MSALEVAGLHTQLDTPEGVLHAVDGVDFAIRKGETALKTELNAAIKAIRANGTYKKINDKYFKIDVYGK